MNRPPFWSRPLPLGAALRFLGARPVGLALGLGVALRLLEFAYDRSTWLDEGSLIGCIARVSEVGLFGPLGSTQLAPPGFLAAEWLATHVLGTSTRAYRLVPLIGGIAALFLFRRLAHRYLSPCGELLAVLLFALTDDLIYYSAEVKQYATDLALSLAVLLAAERVAERAALSVRRSGLLVLGGLGAALVWCSHPLAFTLAAVGTVGLMGSVVRRDGRAVPAWIAVGLVWGLSLAAVRAVGMRQLGYRGDMWAFWQFAFPPWPIASVGDLLWPARRLLFLFVAPLNFDNPLGEHWPSWVAASLAVVGAICLGRSDSAGLARMLLPGAFALLAAALRVYPFHGRLVLFWAPLLLILVAGGLDAVPVRWFRWLLIALVLSGPALTAGGYLLAPRQRSELNPFGDRRPARLDPNYYPWPAPRTEIGGTSR